MLSRSGLDVVSSQNLNSSLLMSTFTSDASNATATRYHYTRERSGEITLYTNPYSFQGIYIIYVRKEVEKTYCIRILHAPPSPLFHKEWVVKSFKLTRKLQQISGFLLNTSEKYIFSKIFGAGATAPPPPCPSASYGLDIN